MLGSSVRGMVNRAFTPTPTANAVRMSGHHGVVQRSFDGIHVLPRLRSTSHRDRGSIPQLVLPRQHQQFGPGESLLDLDLRSVHRAHFHAPGVDAPLVGEVNEHDARSLRVVNDGVARQNRVTDHRIGLTLYNLADIIDGRLDELLEALKIADRAEKLKA